MNDSLSSISVSSADYWNEKLHFTMQTNGELPAVGSQAPDFCLTTNELNNVTLATYKGKRKILNILPSLDVPMCMALTRKLNHEQLSLENTVLLTISADLPFAQRQFCMITGLHDMVTLSTFRSTFGIDYGVQIVSGELTGLMAQAIVVVDEQNNVIHTQIATGLADELDCEAIITLLKPTVSVSSNILNTPTQLKDRRESFRINTLIVAPPPCYCKIELVAPKEDATATYKRAYALATDTIYEKLKQQRKNAANLIVKDVGASNIMQLNLRDISSSGCSMFNHDEAFSYFLVPNTIYKDCSIHVLDYDEVKVSFRIVLKHRIGNYNLGGFNEIIGVEFINMTQAIESTISYYVREIERRQISLFNEETGT